MAAPDPIDFGIGRLFHLTSEAIVVVDLESERIALWNDAAQRIFGYTAADAVGMHLDALFPAASVGPHRSGILRYRETGKPELIDAGAVDLPAVSKSGEELLVALSLTDVSQVSTDRRYVVAVIRDVTAQRRAEAQLAAANESMKQFVAAASHDLRSPLAVVEGFATMLVERRDRLSDANIAEALAAIQTSAQQASRLVSDLLTLSQIRAEAMHTRAEVVLVADAARAAITAAGVDAELDVEPDTSVLVDPDHLQRILVNYLTNAIRYGKPPFYVRATPNHGWVEIAVCDSGDGPPSNYRERLFDPFARADNSRSDGAGLGLSIVRGLAESNGGSAYFLHNGESRFCVTLPAP